MEPDGPDPPRSPSPADGFQSTRWSLALAARDRDAPRAGQALASLCAAYWYPIYAFIRRRGHDPEATADLTQEFFARILKRKFLRAADRRKGRFRSFRLVLRKRFLANKHDKAAAPLPGGGRAAVPLDAAGAEGRYRRGLCHGPTPEANYALEVTNTTERLLWLFVAHGLEGMTPTTDTITVAGGQTRDVFGTVSPADLPDDPEKAKDLKLRITEEDEAGRRLDRDLVVPFRKIAPSPTEIGTAVAYNDGTLTLEVTHSKDDRVTAPALVHVRMEPMAAVRRIDDSPMIVPMGETVQYRYVVDPGFVPARWSLVIDEVEVRSGIAILHPR